MKKMCTMSCFVVVVLAGCIALPGGDRVPVKADITLGIRNERVQVEDAALLRELVSMFPNYADHPSEGLSSGHWRTEYIVDLSFADGTTRKIIVTREKWTAGATQREPVNGDFAGFFLRLKGDKTNKNDAKRRKQ